MLNSIRAERTSVSIFFFAASTMMYEAEELGIHTIWIRGFDSKTVADTYELPDYMIPVMMLGLGYPNENSRANAWHYRRKPIEEFYEER